MKNIKEFYRTKYKGSLFVVKVGGRVITDEKNRKALLEDIKDLTDSGINILLIYGGGHAIDEALAAAQIETHKVNGRRVTTPDAIAVIQKVMAGDLGFRISSTMAAIGLHGLTLSNIPPNWGQIAFRERENPNFYGYDGVLKAVFEDQIKRIFGAISFIACPCTGVSEKSAVNINADNVAVALAEGVHARKLIFLTDVDGVMDKDGNLIPLITDKEIPHLIESGVVEGGMRVKMENCMHALEKGVRRIHLINGFKDHALAEEIYDSIGPGTLILRDADKDSYLNEVETQKVIERKIK